MKYIINGKKKLNGEVVISGAKNSALKLMAASILTEEEVIIKNVPLIGDVFIMLDVLKSLGVKTKIQGHTLTLKADNLTSYEAPFDLVNKMRASILVLGPLLARLGCSRVALPGGCKIGLRKIDIHIRGLEELGVEVEVQRGFIDAKTKGLKGKDIVLDFPSVGATENIMMAAVLASGVTTIENAAKEPEIVDLANFLISCGAKIYGAGTDSIIIQGVTKLKGTNYTVVNDRIEAGTYMLAAAITRGTLFLKGAVGDHLRIAINYFKEAGLIFEEYGEGIKIISNGKIKPVDLVTLPFPGFPTDLQGPVVSVLSVAGGTSRITENIFEGRFSLIDELEKMGAKIKIHNHHALIKGVKDLLGTTVNAPDLRGGAALIIAGLGAVGQTIVEDVGHIARGYEDLEHKLRGIGGDISTEF